jgi:hypothetical protein
LNLSLIATCHGAWGGAIKGQRVSVILETEICVSAKTEASPRAALFYTIHSASFSPATAANTQLANR